MITDLYYRCTNCPGEPRGICEQCGNRAYIPVGYTAEHVADMRDHLAEGAAMMLALRDERTQLKKYLEEARDRLVQGKTKMLALIASSDRLKELLRESADLNTEYTVRLEAVGRVLGEQAVLLGVDPIRLAALIEAKLPEVRAEFRAEADAGRN